MIRAFFLAGTSFAALTCPMMASAQSSTETFSYDALGRLIKAETTGGQNNGETRELTCDPAGNRTSYASTCATGSCAPAPTPTQALTPAPTPTLTPIPDGGGLGGGGLEGGPGSVTSPP